VNLSQPKGYLITTDPDPTRSKGQKAVVENDTVTCGHCGAIKIIPPMCKPADMPVTQCFGCRRFICLNCDDIRVRTLTCDVIENKLERAEARDRFRRSMEG
jgi:hypothetical protein